MKIVYTAIAFLISLSLFGQDAKGTKIMDEQVYDLWNRISKRSVSADGSHVTYQLDPGKGDPSVVLYNTAQNKSYKFEQSHSPALTDEGDFMIFKSGHPKDSIRLLKRQKVKKKDFPKDTLSIFENTNNNWVKIPDLKSFKLPKKWNSHLAYHLEPQKNLKIDTTMKVKKESKKNGSKLIVRHLKSQIQDTLFYVTDYIHSEEGGIFAAVSKGATDEEAGVYIYSIDKAKWQPILRGKAEIKQLSFDLRGTQLAFLLDRDTTEIVDRPYELFHWQKDKPAALSLANNESNFKPKKQFISGDRKPFFSDNGQHLFFGLKDPAIVQDTNLLDEDIVNVEVWSHTDELLHTHQEKQLEQDKKKSYLSSYHIKTKKFKVLQDPNVDYLRFSAEGNARHILGIEEKKYSKYLSWVGRPLRDVFTIDVKNGSKNKIASKIQGSPRLSPKGKYAYWYSSPDSTWIAHHIPTKKTLVLTDNRLGTFYDEQNDRPMHPRSYNSAGWSEDDQFFYVYDRYDIWKIDPKQPSQAQRITKGREDQIIYRRINLDADQKNIPTSETIFLNVFDEKDKSGGYASLDPKTGKLQILAKGPYRYGRRPIKASKNDLIVSTRENFKIFPDLIISRDSFKTETTISDINPQQADYAWGDIELFNWTSFDDLNLTGLLVTPQDFDPKKKYPLIVNFYERSSNRLNNHRAPSPGRSTINYSYYTNRGYVIFNPDVIYTNGKPGESCYNAVISGVEALLEKGFIDKDRIGVQGHSWGGYQIAHLITKTDLFKCAESGAPVVNMISAYGGIRWRTGMSRMFQYEKTQSRLGSTLWEDPQTYIDNSPIFNVDKINTPVLILHNDKDGAVPWYQGIEFFVALRRLSKPAWLLNYNDEPHWPLKRQNRLDFNKRMQQFFDHYLMDEPQAKWMQEGVPAIDKGINQNLELID